ncbi:formate/nitrite transporter family protein [Neisseria chenwenguii]|uniref:Formate/nitrite transporter n=1 Tax=Neisseria chenwenguii TaxID=1853278 RepID=A0A220S0S0_9NEIS|nr:formate/nitrite transporter family protein [Neisseria chenwenguii]ASK26805.1 formate/nitrite transporter [Neisseria chenwenguii]ROV56782.1 formate/nitrite transporter family protein [Neisseria chenwenguii]
MSDFYPHEILNATVGKGIAKGNGSTAELSVLGFLGGAFISLGYLAYIRVVGGMPEEWGSLATLLGAAVFPIGLICILLGGGELITSNMMVLPVAVMMKKITAAQWLRNWLIVTLANVIGAFFVAWFFGHYLGLTEGRYLHETIHVAEGKVAADFGHAVVSGIGCNWMVAMGAWLCYGAHTYSGKILAIWFPIMIFVLIGFQHVVANMFVIPAAIWAGADITWTQFAHNMISVYIGNAIGGAVFVGVMYTLAYRKQAEAENGHH